MADFSIGLIEVSALGNAIIMLDDMLKAADVEFVATERRLGGRLVPHSSTLAWKISWTEEPGRLQSMGSQSVRHD